MMFAISNLYIGADIFNICLLFYHIVYYHRYCNAVYDFPRQEDVTDKCVSVATSHVADNNKTLIVVGSYSIGNTFLFCLFIYL